MLYGRNSLCVYQKVPTYHDFLTKLFRGFQELVDIITSFGGDMVFTKMNGRDVLYIGRK